MLPIEKLYLGFNDAENYGRRENKDLFGQIFLRTPELEQICNPSTYFLIGEKGTGKTAYAMYMSNFDYNNNKANISYIRETEYLKFVSLKQKHHLDLSDFTAIWKVILYLIISQHIRDSEKNLIYKASSKFKNLENVIDDFYSQAFAPEIIDAFKFVENAEISANLLAKIAEVGGKLSSTSTSIGSNFQINLMYIKQKFEQALGSIKLEKNHILFIDGIDIRPASIDYETYLDCIKGLAEAVWSTNNDFFADIKDSKGRIRVILLIRPDIFSKLGLQNLNSKVNDNSVVLNWLTTYSEYRTSSIFLLADKILNYQQKKECFSGFAWDYYFSYDAKNVSTPVQTPSSFIMFLRYCLYRPRNLLRILKIQQENFVKQNNRKSKLFSYEDFFTPEFTRSYSDYLLGEVKDQILFYYDSQDYEKLLKFFQFLNGKSCFTYKEFLEAFSKHGLFLSKNNYSSPTFCETPDILLQFLYDLNILGYISETESVGKPFYSWCNRDRTLSNIAPKVRTHVKYEIHYGLMKAIDLGNKFKIDDRIEWNYP